MSDTTGWNNGRKTINGTEYILCTDNAHKRLWWTRCDGWRSRYYATKRYAQIAAHDHARSKA